MTHAPHAFTSDTDHATCSVCGDWPNAGIHTGHTKGPVTRTITDVLPSAHWATAVVVVTSECQHRHVRPASMGLKVGDTFDCRICEI